MIYAPLSQTTFQFTTTKTINGSSGINVPGSINLPKLRTTINDEIQYFPIIPMTTGALAMSFESTYTADQGQTTGTTMSGYYLKVVANPICSKVSIDGDVYYGYRNAVFGFGQVNVNANMPQINVDAVTLTVIKYVAAEGTVNTETYDAAAISIPALNISSGYTGVQSYKIVIPKQRDDIILGIYAEYAGE